MPSIPRVAVRGGLVLAAVLALAACATGSPDTSFDPATPCTRDGQFAGAYPALEAELPAALDGASATSVDSGRNCTTGTLGTLATHDVTEVRFAGALWEVGERSGVRIAVFEAPGLTTDWLAEFYEAGARSARRTDRIRAGPFEAGDVTGRRLDAFVDTTYQTVVVVDGPRRDLVRAVLVATDLGEAESRVAHDELVARAVEAAVEAGWGRAPTDRAATATRPTREPPARRAPTARSEEENGGHDRHHRAACPAPIPPPAARSAPYGMGGPAGHPRPAVAGIDDAVGYPTEPPDPHSLTRLVAVLESPR